MPADNLQSYKISLGEQSSSIKQDNMIQAIEDGLNSIENANVATNAAIAVSKLAAAGTNEQFLKTIAGVPTWTDGWTSYTPVWASSGTPVSLGNGVVNGRYIQWGKIILAHASVTMGSTTTFGTGTYSLTLPVTATQANMVFGASQVVFQTDASAGPANTFTFATLQNTTTMFAITNASSSVGQLVPFTWAQNDVLRMAVIYEAA